jgi:hypothetical protein
LYSSVSEYSLGSEYEQVVSSLPVPPGLGFIHLLKSNNPSRFAALVGHHPKIFQVIEHRLDFDGTFYGNTEPDPASGLHSKVLPQLLGQLWDARFDELDDGVPSVGTSK